MVKSDKASDLPMTARQKERLELLKIDYNGDETMDEAASLLRSKICEPLYQKPVRLPESAFAVCSEGDPLPGRSALND